MGLHHFYTILGVSLGTLWDPLGRPGPPQNHPGQHLFLPKTRLGGYKGPL